MIPELFGLTNYLTLVEVRIKQSLQNLLFPQRDFLHFPSDSGSFFNSQRPNKGLYIFILGVIIYFWAQAGMFRRAYQLRQVPLEADDAYAYIVKAAQLEEYFFQDVPALHDIRKQVLTYPSDIFKKARIYRRGELFRGLVVYAPLHSILLSGLHRAGFSWVAAYKILSALGIVAITWALGFWLYVLWGPGAAGVALFLLAYHISPGYGLHYITPGNLALSLAMTTWGAVVRWRERAGWFMVGAVLVMVAMHPIGRLYGLAALALYLFLQTRPWPPRSWIITGTVLFLVMIPFLLPYVVSRPDFKIPWYMSSLRLEEFSRNFDKAISILKEQLYGRSKSYLLLAALGFVCADRGRKRAITGILGLLGGMLLLSLIHWRAGRPALLFMRLCPSFLIVFFGAVGNAAWLWSDHLVTFFQRKFQERSISAFFRELFARKWSAGLMIALGLILGTTITSHLTFSRRNYERMIKIMTHRQNFALDPDQPAILMSQYRKGDSVFYTNGLAMHFFLTHGAYRLGAVYGPAVRNTPEEAFWLRRNKTIRYLVAWNVIKHNQGTLPLYNNRKVVIKCATERRLDTISFRLDNPGDEAVMELSFPHNGKRKSIRLRIPSRFSGWLGNPAEMKPASDIFEIRMARQQTPVKLKGVRFDSHNSLNWPWDQGISLVVHTSFGKSVRHKTIRFQSAKIVSEFGRPLKIIADSGSTLLAEVGPFPASPKRENPKSAER